MREEPMRISTMKPRAPTLYLILLRFLLSAKRETVEPGEHIGVCGHNSRMCHSGIRCKGAHERAVYSTWSMILTLGGQGTSRGSWANLLRRPDTLLGPELTNTLI